MFIPEDMKYFQNVGKLGNEKNEFKKFYLNMMMGLPDEFWEYVYKEFKKFEEKKGKQLKLLPEKAFYHIVNGLHFFTANSF